MKETELETLQQTLCWLALLPILSSIQLSHHKSLKFVTSSFRYFFKRIFYFTTSVGIELQDYQFQLEIIKSKNFPKLSFLSQEDQSIDTLLINQNAKAATLRLQYKNCSNPIIPPLHSSYGGWRNILMNILNTNYNIPMYHFI